MKNLIILAFALIASGSAFAAENNKLTAAQMDTVSAGSHDLRVNAILISAVQRDVIDINRNDVLVAATPVNGSVAAGILGNGGVISQNFANFVNHQ